MAALHGWGQAAKAIAECSGVVPVIMVVDGPAVSGPALLLGLADFVVMTAARTRSSRDRRWWPSSQASPSTTTSSAARPRTPARAARRRSWSPMRRPPSWPCASCSPTCPRTPTRSRRGWPSVDPPDRLTPEAGELMPTTTTGSYDVRDVMAAIVDDGIVLELRGRWAPNLVTAFATVDGRPVGILANQPLAIAGTLDIPASQKGARFVVVLRRVQPADHHPRRHTGLLPRQGPGVAGHDPPRRAAGLRVRAGHGRPHLRDPAQELWRRVHRHGLQADGERRLPRVAGSGAGGHGRRAGRGHPPAPGHTGRAGRLRGRLLGPPAQPLPGGRTGHVDAVIEPGETRREISRALRMLATKREDLRPRKHDNTPL